MLASNSSVSEHKELLCITFALQYINFFAFIITNLSVTSVVARQRDSLYFSTMHVKRAVGTFFIQPAQHHTDLTLGPTGFLRERRKLGLY